MNYGIITHYDVHNHGAVLQLYGLIQILKSLGVNAKALQFDKNYDFMGRAIKAKYEISLKSVGFYLKFLYERGLKSVIYNFRKKRTLDKFKNDAGLIGDYYTESGHLDGVVVGSDEVFALHTGPTPVFWGHALPTDNVFAYAGCFGPTTMKDIDRLHCRAFTASGLSSMKGLGMRDANSMQIAKELTGKTPELVCDPVILYGFEQELMNKRRPIKERYMIVYAYDTRMNELEEQLNIRKYANEHGLKLVSPGFYHQWVDKNINVDPIELLNYFQWAECVVTDTFHGCVMSLITHREVAVRLRDNANKLFNLMKEYGIDSRTIGDDWNLSAVFGEKVNWEKVNSEMDNRTTASMSYLKRMIEK